MLLPVLQSPFEYHIAVSYAGEDGPYVKAVVDSLLRAGASVYFDKSAETLGKHLGVELFDVYHEKAQYCVVFVSEHYARKKYTRYEFAIIHSRYIDDPKSLIPVRVDGTPLKGLIPAIGFADIRVDGSPETTAQRILSSIQATSPVDRSLIPGSAQIPFVGRAAEIQGIEDLLSRDAVKILLLQGEGGIGKTRLAMEVARKLEGRFRDRSRFVDLTAIRRPELVPKLISKVLDIKEEEGVLLEKSVKDYLQKQNMLLVLDKLEHLSAAGVYVRELGDCPELKILVTSRWPVEGLDGAQIFPVPPLSLPAGRRTKKEAVQGSDAVELFRVRALVEEPHFDLGSSVHEVAEICAKVGRLPMAILLVASEVKRHSLQEILHLLDRYLKAQPGGLKKLEKAMGASIDWSYDRLGHLEQALFRRLSVFSGSFTPEAAFEVCGRDLHTDLRESLEMLTDRSLLQKELNGGPAARFRMTEVIREYAFERLRQVDGAGDFQRRHAEHFTLLAETADRSLKAAGQRQCLDTLEVERSNLQAALEWCLSKQGDREMGLRLAGHLFWFWNLRADFSEGRSWLARVLGEPSVAHAKALYADGGLAFLQGEYGEARQQLEESVRIWRKLLPAHERDLGYALIVLGMTALGLGDCEAGLAAELEAVEIFKRHDKEDPWGLALALNDLGNVRRRRGEIDDAAKLYRRSLAHWQAIKDSWGTPLTLSNLGFLLMMQQEYAEARKYLVKAQDSQTKSGDLWGQAETWKYMGDLEVRSGNFSEAGYLYRESLELNLQIGRKQFMVGCLCGLFVVAAYQRLDRIAARLYGATKSLRASFNLSPRLADEEKVQEAYAYLPSETREARDFRSEQEDGELDELPDLKLDRIIRFALETFPPRPRKTKGGTASTASRAPSRPAVASAVKGRSPR